MAFSFMSWPLAYVLVVAGTMLIIALMINGRSSPANVLLSVILTICIYRQTVITVLSDPSLSPPPWLPRTLGPFQMISIPAIYLFLKAFTERNFSFRSISKLHALPFILGSIAYGFIELKDGSSQISRERISIDMNILSLTGFIVSMPYVYFFSKHMASFQKGIMDC